MFAFSPDRQLHTDSLRSESGCRRCAGHAWNRNRIPVAQKVGGMKDRKRKNILILDPERDIAELFARALETHKECKCYLAATERELMDLLRDVAIDVLLVDISAVKSSDYGLLRKIRRLYPGVIVVVDAYLHQKDQINLALAQGAHGFIIKPIKVDLFRKKMDEF